MVYVIVLLLLNLGASAIAYHTDSNHVIGSSISDDPSIYGGHEVAFIGDSRAHQGVDPRIFNRIIEEETGKSITSINIGRPALQMPFAYYIIENQINHSKTPPKTIVMNISFYLLGGKQWMRDIYYNYFNLTPRQTYDTYQFGLSNPLRALASYPMTHTPMIRHLKRLRSDRTLFFRPNPLDFWKNVVSTGDARRTQFDPQYFGYRPRKETHISEDEVKIGIYKKGVEQGYGVFFDYMDRLFALAQKHDIEIFLYEFPWPEQRNNPDFHAVLDYYQTKIRDVAAPYPNVYWKDHDYFWSTEHFVDPLHVNPHGAERLTKQVAQWYLEHKSQ